MQLYYKIIKVIEFIAILAGVLFFGTFLATLMIEAIARNNHGTH
jgi:hypothetical protein|tara:strand:- start:2970 stop:3101 length:132 start_codon:yes stop_codon:yes gene_type:complete